MALNNLSDIKPDDPRLKGHETTYQASRGGSFPKPPAPNSVRLQLVAVVPPAM